MALVKSPEGTITVAEGIHLAHVGTEPQEIPAVLLPAALAQGCVEVKVAKPAPKTATKTADKAEA